MTGIERFRRLAEKLSPPDESTESRVLRSCAKEAVACYQDDDWDYRIAIYLSHHANSADGATVGIAYRNLRPRGHEVPYRVRCANTGRVLAEGDLELVPSPSSRPQYGSVTIPEKASWSTDGVAQAGAVVHPGLAESPAGEASLLARARRSEACVCCGSKPVAGSG